MCDMRNSRGWSKFKAFINEKIDVSSFNFCLMLRELRFCFLLFWIINRKSLCNIFVSLLRIKQVKPKH